MISPNPGNNTERGPLVGGETTQYIETLDRKPNGLSSIPGTTLWKEGTNSHRLPSVLNECLCMGMGTYEQTQCVDKSKCIKKQKRGKGPCV